MTILTKILTVMLTLLVAAPAMAADYKSYSREEKILSPVVVLTAEKDEWIFESYENSEITTYVVEIPYISKTGASLTCGDDVMIDSAGITFPDRVIAFEDIGSIGVDFGASANDVVLSFYPKDESKRKTSFRRRMSDKISVDNEIIVTGNTFIRGSVIALYGDVIINGEVNGDVVALLGDIQVNADAVIRGDAISADGSVRLNKDASVYGVVQSGSGKQSSRRSRARRWKHRSSDIELYGVPNYNRVDGLFVNIGAKYEHRDSLLPSFHASLGYAFASEQWRYDVGLSQTLLRGRIPIEIGGHVFRELKSDDDRIIDNQENMIFALIVNEDWKDYYEAEGAYGFIRSRPLRWHEIEIGYLAEEYDWYDAHPKLWSLFGAKDFRGNFSSVPYGILTEKKPDLIDKKLTSLNIQYTVNTLENAEKRHSGWFGRASYEFSPERWNGDFDFTRIEGRLKRFQRLNRYQSLSFTASYGYVRGDYIPLNRYFFLGGLGTLHGYRHKEFMGREYLLAGAEYRFRIPRTGIAPFLHWDGGRISADRLGSEDGWLSSISLGVDVENYFRLFVSQRLDRDDEDPVIYARFTAKLFN